MGVLHSRWVCTSLMIVGGGCAVVGVYICGTVYVEIFEWLLFRENRPATNQNNIRGEKFREDNTILKF